MDAGVRHIVFLSLLGAEKNPVVPHRRIETHLQSANVDHTFLRASFVMQILSTTHSDDVKVHDEIFVPAGTGKTSFVDARDIAAVAMRALTKAGHESQTYDLPGPEALTYHEVAQILTELLGRKIVFANPSIPRFMQRMSRRDYPFGYILVMTGPYTINRLGLAARVTDDLEQILGRSATTFRAFAEDYQTCWKPGAQPIRHGQRMIKIQQFVHRITSGLPVAIGSTIRRHDQTRYWRRR